MSLVFPGMLWGLAACGIPVLIHLWLRPKPRRQVFAAVRLLRAVAPQAERRRRARHLWLLALRMLLLAILTLALARPLTGATGGAGGPRGATQAVLCLDDSASMDYRDGRHSRRDRAAEWAGRLLFDQERFPRGSRYSVIRTSQPTASPWSERPEQALRTLRLAASGLHDRSVHGGIAAAMRRTAGDAGLPQEVYLLTDLTRHSWRGTAAILSAEAGASGDSTARTSLIVCDLGGDEHDSAGISLRAAGAGGEGSSNGMHSPPMKAIQLPANQPAELTADLRTGDRPWSGRIGLTLNERVVWTSDARNVAERRTREVVIPVPPQPAGLVGGMVWLDPMDAQAADNVWYVAIQFAERPTIAVVSPESARSERSRIATLLAPPSLPDLRRPWTVVEREESSLAGAVLGSYAMVVLIEPTDTLRTATDAIAAWVREGGSLLVVAGPSAALAVWGPDGSVWGRAPSLGGGRAGQTSTLPDDGVIDPTPTTIAAAASAESNVSVAGRTALRHARWNAAAGDEVTAQFANGDAAIVRRSVDRGRVTWWAFSLRREWGDLGVRAAAALVQLHQLARAAAQPADGALNIFCDERIAARPDGRRLVAESTALAGLFITPPAASQASATDKSSSRPAAMPNHGGGVLAVNLRPGECDGQRISVDEIAALYPSMPVRIVRDPRDLSAPTAAVGTTDWSGPAALAVLVLLLWEAGAARRSAPPVARPSPAVA